MIPTNVEAEIASDTSSRGVATHDFRSHEVSTVGDYGSQGVSTEGVFGTAGAGDKNATASGRYDNYAHKSATAAHTGIGSASEQASASTLVCFCGNKMRQIGSNQDRTRAASMRWVASEQDHT
jgi:hypothetical protein